MPGQWKVIGGINRSSKSNIVNNNIQTTSQFTPKTLGFTNTTIDNYSDINYRENTALYNMHDTKTIFNDIICYYPFNNLNDSSFNSTNANIKNETSNKSLVDSNYFNLFTKAISVNSINPIIVDTTFSQKAIEFRNNSKYLITSKPLNNLNVFGQTINTQSISTILTLQTYVYIPTGTQNLCIFSLDDVNQSGLNNPNMNTDVANCFYLWFKGGSNNLQTQMYYYFRSDTLSTPINITNNSCGEITLNKWNKIMFVFGGSYIALYINNKETFRQQVGGGSFIPQKNFAINLGPYYSYTNSPGFVSVNTNIQNSNSGTAFLDTRVILSAHSKEFIEYFSTTAEGHQFVTNNIPNKEIELAYLLSKQFSIVNTPLICENDITTSGVHNSFGKNNFYAESTFLDSVHFYSDVIFDKNVTYVVDSSLVNMWEIFSEGSITNNKKAALLIQNAGGLSPPSSGSTNFPSMLVYNSSNRITDNTNTQNLVFSISGESVSIGENYGTSNFNVSGSSNFNGNCNITGNLGIGITDNTYKLSVIGNSLLDGRLTVRGKTIHENGSEITGDLIHSGGNIHTNSTIDASSVIIQNYSELRKNVTIGNNIVNGSNQVDTNYMLSVFGGNVGVNENLIVEGDISGGNNISCQGDITCANATVKNNMDVSGVIDVSSVIIQNYGEFHKNVTIGNNIVGGKNKVDPNYMLSVFGGNNISAVGINGDIDITGDIKHVGKLDVSGGFSLNGNITHNGNNTHHGHLDVTGGITLNGGMLHTGNFTHKDGDMTTNSTINANSVIIQNYSELRKNVTIGNNIVNGSNQVDTNYMLSVFGGNVGVNENLIVEGDISGGNNISCQGDITCANATVKNNMDVSGVIDVSSVIIQNYGEFHKNVTIGNNIVGGKNKVNPNYMLSVFGGNNISAVGINGDIDITGDIKHVGKLDISGGFSLNGNITHNGNNTHKGHLDVTGGITLNGGMLHTGNFTHKDGEITTNSTINANSVIIQNYSELRKNVTIGNNIVNGSNQVDTNYMLSVFGGNDISAVGISGGIDITGDIRHVGKLDVSGGFSLNGNITHNGNNTHNGHLGVTGGITLNGKVVHSGDFNHSGGLFSCSNLTVSNTLTTNIIKPNTNTNTNGLLAFGTTDALYAYDFNYSKPPSEFQCLHIHNRHGGKGCITAIGFNTYTGRYASTEPPTQIRATDNGGFSQDLSFWTTFSSDGPNANAAIERMRIDQNGNISIGSPYGIDSLSKVNTLQIYPSLSQSNGYQKLGYAAQTIGVNITPPDGYGNIYQLAANGGITGASAINFCADGEGGGSDSAQFSIWTSPQQVDGFVNKTEPLQQRLAVCGNGNVGIGTSSPSAKLHIHQEYANSGSYPAGEIKFSTNNSTTTWQMASIGTYVAANNGGTSGYPGGLVFKTKAPDNDHSSLPVERMVIDSNGNVGIGTRTPNATLDVSGDIILNGKVVHAGDFNHSGGTMSCSNLTVSNTLTTKIIRPYNANGLLAFGTTDALYAYDFNYSKPPSEFQGLHIHNRHGGEGCITAIGFNTYTGRDASTEPPTQIRATDNGGFSQDLSFWTTPSSDGPNASKAVERMRIDQKGNVGIGTRAPQATLDVSGDIILNGKVVHAGDFNHSGGTMSCSSVTSDSFNSPIANYICWPTGVPEGNPNFFINNDGLPGEGCQIYQKAQCLFFVNQNPNPNPFYGISDWYFVFSVGQPYERSGMVAINKKGDVLANGTQLSSDRRLKKNIVPIQYGLESILSLKPVSYMFKIDNDTTHLGFIAQDVENVLPELVNKNNPEKLTLDYNGIIPVLTNAVKELNTKHENELASVKDELASVKDELSSVKAELDELRDFKKEILARLEQLESNK